MGSERRYHSVRLPSPITFWRSFSIDFHHHCPSESEIYWWTLCDFLCTQIQCDERLIRLLKERQSFRIQCAYHEHNLDAHYFDGASFLQHKLSAFFQSKSWFDFNHVADKRNVEAMISCKLLVSTPFVW